MKNFFYLIFAAVLAIGLSNCSIFEPEEFQPFVTFEKTFGVGGVYNAFDVIELESNYLIVGAGGPQCNVVDASSLLLDKITGQQINFNSFGRVGFGSQDYLLDVERLGANDFIAIGRSLIINEDCESGGNPDAELFLASFDFELNSIREPLFFNSDTALTSSKWDAGFNVSTAADKLYIAGAWGALNSLFITDVNNSEQDIWYREGLLGQYFDVDINNGNEFVITGEIHNYSWENSFADFRSALNYDLDSAGWSLVFTKIENCMDGNCNIIAEKFYAMPEMKTLVGKSIKKTDDNGFIIIGQAVDLSDMEHIFLLRIDANGEEISNRIISGEGLARDIVKVDDGYVITGRLDGDLFMMKIDDMLNELWPEPVKYNNIGNTGKQEGATIIKTKDGGLMAVGFSELGRNNNTMYIVKTDASGKVQ